MAEPLLERSIRRSGRRENNIKVNFMEIGYKFRIGSGSCPIAEFGISGVEHLGFNTAGLCTNLKHRMNEIRGL
jgi:hypothetical protein